MLQFMAFLQRQKVYLYFMARDQPTANHPNILVNKANPEIANKFGFFGDCFDMVNTNAGEHADFETETHLSVINSLVYLIEEAISNPDPKFTPYTIKHAQYLLEHHPLLNSEDAIIKKFYSGIQINIDAISNLVIDKSNLSINLTEISSNLKAIQQLVSTNYLEGLVSEIIKCIVCKHKLNKHKDVLNYFAKLLVSYYYFNGYSRKRISNFFKNILDSDVEVAGKQIGADSPVPWDLYQKLVQHNRSENAFDQELYSQLEDYFEKRTMKQQVEGFLHLSKYEKNEFTFYFKLEGVYYKASSQLIDGIKLISTENFIREYSEYLNDVGRIYVTEPLKSFLTKSSALVEIKTQAYSLSDASEIAISILKEKVGRIGFYLNKKLQLETFEYINKHKNGDLHLREFQERVHLMEWDFASVKTRSLGNLKAEFSDYFLKLENVLIQAWIEPEINKALHIYSKFTEQLTKGLNINNDKNSSKYSIPNKIMCATYLLLLQEKQRFNNTVKIWGFNVVINAHHNNNILKNPIDRVKLGNNNKLYSLSKLSRILNHQHTLYRVKSAHKYDEKVNYTNAFHYYTRINLMLLKYRNIQEHSIKEDEHFKRRLKITVNTFFYRILQSVYIELKQSSNANFSVCEVMDNLVKKGKTIVDSHNIPAL